MCSLTPSPEFNLVLGCFLFLLWIYVAVASSISQPPMDLKGIDASLSAYVNVAWAETTQRTRSLQWSKFINFCHCHSLVPVPAGNMTVARFLVFLANTCTYSTCNNYLSAVVGLHRHLDAEQSFRNSYLISLVLKGIAQVKGKQVSAKVGFMPEDLSCMFASLDVSDVNNTALWSALMLSFRSLLRKSNLVPDTTLDCQSVLKRADVEFTNERGSFFTLIGQKPSSLRNV